MRRIAAEIVWLALSLFGVGDVRACAQELERGTKNGEMNAAQPQPDADPQEEAPDANTIPAAHRHWSVQLLKDFGGDQKDLWTSPKNLRIPDTVWLVPVSGITAGLLVTDADYNRHISHNPSTVSNYKTISNAGIAAMIGGAGAMWALSYANHNSHWRETGFLAGEATVNSLVVTEVLKYSLGRERPNQDNGAGNFFAGGVSFPSEHSAAAWSIAAVIAHEYPGPLSKFLAYGAASLISYSRVRAQQHFPSDVFVGALIGELSAYTVYKRHHDPGVGGEEWESWSNQARRMFEEPTRANMGSPYVPLDNWVYPAIERLMALGLIDSGFLAHRPWTRWECARLITEASDRVSESDLEANKILAALLDEFRRELEPPSGGVDVQLDSVYTRLRGITGPTLGRGQEAYDFGQTFINDYGRPYAEGANAIAGFSFYTTGGPWVGYVQGEYEHAPSAPPLTLSERTFIPTVTALQSGSLGVLPATPFAAANNFRFVEAYAGMQFSNWLVSFGPQTLWSGPTQGGAMLLSTNSEAIPMIRIARVSPMNIPWVSKVLGPAWFEFFFGQVAGHHLVQSLSGTNEFLGVTGNYLSPLQNQPYIHGERMSWKPTRNFEFGLTRTVLFGGGPIPMTLGYFKNSLFDIGEHTGGPGTSSDPGKQASELDWNYRLPLMRKWVTFYGDAITWDQISPIAYWDRSAISAGLYFSHFPKLSKLDFRAEGVYTDVPAGGALSHGFWYSSLAYLNGFTNGGNLIGSWIGREGQGAQAWTNYWFTPKNRLQLYFRHLKVSQQFLPGGGTLTDVGLQADFWTSPRWGFSANAQYETWNMPVIQPGQQTNFSSSLQVTYRPKRWGKLSKID